MTNTSTSGEREHGDTLTRVIWASILIFVGLVFLADTTGYLPSIPNTTAWTWIMLGAGALLVLEALIRTFSVDHPQPHLFGLIGGIVLLGIGASAIFGVHLSNAWWPI